MSQARTVEAPLLSGTQTGITFPADFSIRTPFDINDWAQLGLDIDGEATGDQSGYSVSMNAAGDRVAIGAVLNDGNGSESGHVRVYTAGSTARISCPVTLYKSV